MLYKMYKEIVEFIKNLYKTHYVPLHAPIFIGNEKKYLQDCIDSTFVSYVGEFVNKFEDSIKLFTGAKYAIATVNGTSALHISMLLAGVEHNDEVITQPLTFVATCNSIKYIGAYPIFVDISKETLGMDIESLKLFFEKYVEFDEKGNTINKVTKRKIKACIPMHTFGHPCEIDNIIKLCEKYNIPVIEDAAESLGSFYKEKHTGNFGFIGILSFNGNKIVTTGGGGMILTNDEYIAKRAVHITKTAKIPHPYEYYHDEIGYNYRMPNVNAAIGLAQMEQLPKFLKIKREITNQYNEFFKKYDSIKFIEEPEYSQSNYWLNSILFEDKIQRDEFLEYSNKNGVQTRPAWMLMYKLPMFRDCFKIDTYNAEYIEERLVNLPSGVVV